MHTLNSSPEKILSDLSNQLSLVEKQDLRLQLIEYINLLLLEDFNRLLQLLYRVDVSEQKLRNLLRENPSTDAAILIADLLIARQDEKIKTRNRFSKEDDDIPEEDKW